MNFTHLHTHSHYSLLDGLAKIDDLVAKAKEYNMRSLAITDHGVMYGVIEFYQKCKKAEIKPIIGVEVYIAPNGLHNKRAKIDEERFHLVLLAKNNEGYKNLIELTTIAHLEGFYYKPRIDWEVLEKYHKGLIALSACLGGEIPSLIKAGNLLKAELRIRDYVNLFGEENFYLEMQFHKSCSEQKLVNKELINFSKKLNVPLVATNDIHYVDFKDRDAHDILLCLQTKKQLDAKDRMNMLEFDVSFRSGEQMLKDFSDIPEAIYNTEAIVEKCNVEIELGKTKLPYYELPEEVTAEGYLYKLCVQGIKNRYNIKEEELENIRNMLPLAGENKNFLVEVVKRMDYELSIISKVGFASYFLIVQDFVNWSKSNGVVVGPGRGSAAGSLIAYLLNITNLDPLKYDLLFERFLNPERISMPDIDIDFSDDKREDVIRYVEGKYGKDRVAQIITFGTMAARAAIRDVGRVLGVPLNFCDKIAKLIPMYFSLGKALNGIPELKEIYSSNSDAKKLIDTAKKLEGVARHSSRHACGILITQNKLTDYVPLQYASSDDRTIVSQYSLHPVEDLGLLKMDFLGLKNLTIIDRAVKIIKRIHRLEINIDDIPTDDPKTYKLFQEGETTGVFQFESSGMRRYLRELKPTDIEDIIAMVALYRPGPMELIPEYIAVKYGKKKPSYLHPLLKPILDKTHSVAIYQEQLLQIARDLAGFSLGEADVLRRAIGKKIAKLLNEQKTKFIEGCAKNNIKKEIAEKIFAFMEPFAGYGFNRSHAACYAIIAYQTAYLKANFSAEFMASLMTSDYGNLDKIAQEIAEALRMGIEILPPDVNESFRTFTVVRDNLTSRQKIRFGLSAVKNLGDKVVENIKEEREKNGRFKSMEDFIGRMSAKDFNKRSLESLIKSGSVDSFGERNMFLTNIDQLLNYSKNIQKTKIAGQSSLFGENESFKLQLDNATPVVKTEKLLWEREYLGLYISDHPFRDLAFIFKQNIISLSKLNLAEDEASVRIGGIISNIKKIITKKNESMLFAKIEDNTGSGEVIVFPSVLKEYAGRLEAGKMVIVLGKISNKDNIKKIICNEVLEVNERNAKDINKILKPMRFQLIEEKDPLTIKKKVYINIKDSNNIGKLKEILVTYKGMEEVYLAVAGNTVKTNLGILFNEEVKTRIESIVGEGNIKVIIENN